MLKTLDKTTNPALVKHFITIQYKAKVIYNDSNLKGPKGMLEVKGVVMNNFLWY